VHPPVPADRVHVRRDVNVVFSLEHVFKNDVSEFVFEPLAFFAPPATLVPEDCARAACRTASTLRAV